MSNINTIDLFTRDNQFMEVSLNQVKPVLNCLFNTIIFQRALGNLKPKEIDDETLKITYVNLIQLIFSHLYKVQKLKRK